MSASAYLVSRKPEMYGGYQDNYLQVTECVVSQSPKLIESAIRTGQALTETFRLVLETVGEMRQFVANNHDTEDKELFGIPRNQGPSWGMLTTPLSGPYAEYNGRLLSVLQRHLRAIGVDPTQWPQPEPKIDLETALGRRACYKFRMLEESDILLDLSSAKKPFEHLEERAKAACRNPSLPLEGKYKAMLVQLKLLGLTTPTQIQQFLHMTFFNFKEGPMRRICPLLGMPSTGKSMASLHGSKETMERLKKLSVADYKRMLLADSIGRAHLLFPEEKKSDWIVVTLLSEMGGRVYPLTQYLTWINREAPDPITHMTDHSNITVVHQDPFLMDNTLQDVALLFEQAVKWKPEEGLPSLKNRVCLLHYELQHATPFKRGSGAAGEWMEQIIYRYHGYRVTYNDTQLPPFEALTSSLSDFAKNYDTMLTLKKIAEGTATV